MADMGPLVHRRLYEQGFEGWDIQEFSYLTDYLVMAVGITLGFLTYELMKPDQPKVWSLLGQFGLATFFIGVGYGFAGISHHMLDTYFEHGVPMGLAVGEPQSEWIFPWLLKVLTVPFGSACFAGTAYHFAGVGVGWIKLTKGIGLAISCLEFYLTLSGQVEASGTPTVFFGALAAVAAILLVAVKGKGEAGQVQIVLANLAKLLGLAITVLAPRSCRMVGEAREGCPFSETFNHNAWYHVLTALSLVLCYAGVAAKHKKDCDQAYMTIMRTMSAGPNRACCGLA